MRKKLNVIGGIICAAALLLSLIYVLNPSITITFNRLADDTVFDIDSYINSKDVAAEGTTTETTSGEATQSTNKTDKNEATGVYSMSYSDYSSRFSKLASYQSGDAAAKLASDAALANTCALIFIIGLVLVLVFAVASGITEKETLQKILHLCNIIPISLGVIFMLVSTANFNATMEALANSEVPAAVLTHNSGLLTAVYVAWALSAIFPIVAAIIPNEADHIEINDSKDDEYILVVNNLKKYFPIGSEIFKKSNNFVKAVDGVSFKIKRGTTMGLVGESGCGKTTVGRTILRLHEITGGDVVFEGMDLSKLTDKQMRKIRPRIQMIFQDPYSSLSPRMPVGEIIGEAVKVHKIVPKEQYKPYIMKVMKNCGLQPQYFYRYPHEFSGGQRQRICIARAVALDPDLIICDEPVSALDVSIQAQIINLMKDLQDQFGYTYLFISHDLSVVEHISDTVGVMYLGNMVELGPKDNIFDNPLHPYTKALLSAVPLPDPTVKLNRIVLEGDIPSPANPPKGCKFSTRCRKCMKVCTEIAPELIEWEPEHTVACHLYSHDAKIIERVNIERVPDEDNGAQS